MARSNPWIKIIKGILVKELIALLARIAGESLRDKAIRAAIIGAATVVANYLGVGDAAGALLIAIIK